jgi:hypothetical protein
MNLGGSGGIFTWRATVIVVDIAAAIDAFASNQAADDFKSAGAG